MSADKIYLTKEQQAFLMEMLEVKTPVEAVEVFARMMTKEGVDPMDIQLYVSKIMKKGLSSA